MRAHILSERGRTAEGQELLDRVGEIDPEYREARELLGTLEVHRLVLPEAVDITLPPELLDRPNGAVTTVDRLAETGGEEQAREDSTGQASPPAAQLDDSETEGTETPVKDDETSATATDTVDRGMDAKAPIPAETEHSATAAEDLLTADAAVDPEESATGASFSTFDWARHLIEQSKWTEAERVLADIVDANDSDTARVDGLLLEAVAHRELRGSAWKLLGDHYMRTGRPQAAADAYLRAANVSGSSTP
jgi:tetratricopeptide (TPR) repeat protein